MASQRHLIGLGLPTLLGLAAGATAFAIYQLLTSTSFSNSKRAKIIKSPLALAGGLGHDMPYSPYDFIPGARDINTPWGSLRVYEFGPEKADRKVLLVHGISTPCVSLAGIAEEFAAKGCRVMLFDQFGRGWSDTPMVDFDEGLYMSMIFAVLASSPVSWTGSGSGGFSLVGYSLGGAVVANFVSYFPELVEDVVLIAPAGLLRRARMDWRTKLLYSGLLPDFVTASSVRKRMASNPIVRRPSQDATTTSPSVLEQAPGNDEVSTTKSASKKKTPHAFGRTIDAEDIVKWQMNHHEGFLPAFVSSFKNAPIHDQHERWQLIGRRLDSQRRNKISSNDASAGHGLRGGKILVVLGAEDSVISASEFEPDALAVLGAENVEIRRFSAGHEVPMTHSKEIVQFAWERWTATEGETNGATTASQKAQDWPSV